MTQPMPVPEQVGVMGEGEGRTNTEEVDRYFRRPQEGHQEVTQVQ